MPADRHQGRPEGIVDGGAAGQAQDAGARRHTGDGMEQAGLELREILGGYRRGYNP